MNKHPYEKEFVEVYNASVEHDNKTGKVDQKHAIELAKAYAELHIPEWHRKLFVEDFKDFYYHMFD